MDFDLIYKQYFRDVFLYLRSLSANEDIAEEIAQKTFAKALKAIDSYDGQKDIRAWLFTIAKNTYFTDCKRQNLFSGEEPSENIAAPQSVFVEQMLNDFGIKGQLIPTAVPEEFGVPTCWASCDESGLKLEILYQSSEHYIYLWYMQISKKNESAVEKNDRAVTSWDFEGIKHYQLADNGIQKVAWANGAFECLAQSNIESDVFRQVVESIYGG